MARQLKDGQLISTPMTILMVHILIAAVATKGFASAPPPPSGCPSTTTTFDSTDPALPALINGSATVTSTITVSGLDTEIWDVDLITFIPHTYSEDLDFTLTSPAGTVVTITTRNGGEFDNVFDGTTWDDDAGDVNAPGAVTDMLFADNVVATPLVPEEAMGAFIGEDPNGDWTLSINDTFAAIDDGSLDAWSLIITTVPDATVDTATNVPSDDAALPLPITDNSTTTSTLTVDGLDSILCDVDLTTFITHTFAADLDITLTSPAGTVVTITTDNGRENDDVFNGTLWDDNAGDTLAPGPVTEFIFANNVVATPLVPEEALAAFTGEDPNGIWKLEIFDGAGGDQGQLVDWSLDITTCALADDDNDGVGDFCDQCDGDDATGDTDGDGVCDDIDACDGDDATGDTDGDGICNDNDVCEGNDATADNDGDGVCDDADLCDGDDATGDSDGDGVCDDSDPCPADPNNDSDGDGVCDGVDICAGSDDNADADGDGIPDGCDDTPNGEVASQDTPNIEECCGGGMPMMMPFMLIGWRSIRRRRRR